MKILLITSALLSGGTERFLINFSKVFHKCNEIDVAYYRDSNEDTIGELSQFVNNTILLPYYVKHPFEFRREVLKLYKEGKYDYAYVHANHALGIMYTFPAWKKDSATKILYHSHNSEGNQKVLQRIYSKKINKVANKRYSCSEGATKYMYGTNSAYIINNGVDIDRYRYNFEKRKEIREKYGINDKTVYGHIGRFSNQKNHAFLIDIFSEIVKRDSNSVLFLIGKGENKEASIQKINSLGLNDKVIFLDSTSKAGDYYQCFDLFILPSLFEGLPFVGIEAQASGTQCLFSNTITGDIAITPLVQFLGLSDTPATWAEKAIEMADKNSPKKDYGEIITQKGFSIYHMISDYKDSGLDLGEN